MKFEPWTSRVGSDQLCQLSHNHCLEFKLICKVEPKPIKENRFFVLHFSNILKDNSSVKKVNSRYLEIAEPLVHFVSMN